MTRKEINLVVGRARRERRILRAQWHSRRVTWKDGVPTMGPWELCNAILMPSGPFPRRRAQRMAGK